MSPTSRISAAALTILIASTAAASAHSSWPTNIARERERQIATIQQGRLDGSLTWYERFMLAREQKRIAKLEHAALADGRLTRHEYLTIRRAQKDAARHIYRQRHDGSVRGWWWRQFF